MSLTTAGGGTTTYTVFKNGVAQGTVSVGAGVNTSGKVALAITFAALDFATVSCTAVGAGAADATVELG